MTLNQSYLKNRPHRLPLKFKARVPWPGPGVACW